ncbi:hypothetical protein MNB_SM-5-1484 [hydrothermal vent metagenome]|uniref:Uncharacterized protein n=1 Tax=hydrothermal vent metagenome TaxID=652676 RepID=A0A1W1CY53_9ZZZZ
MVKKIGKFFAYLLFFLGALLYFMPKESLYFLGEKELQKYHVVIAHESVKDRGFSLALRHLDLYVESIQSATIERVDIALFAFYNEIEADNIHLSSALASMLPTKIENVDIKYSVLNPLNVTFTAVGDFGRVQGVANIKERKIIAFLKPSSLMLRNYRATLRNFKKQSNGEYKYVQSF